MSPIEPGNRRWNIDLKLVSAALMLVCLAFAYPANAADRLDGNYWNTLSVNGKLTYVVGFFDGLMYSGHYVHSVMTPAQQELSMQLKRDFDHLTSDNIKIGLDKVYHDYRNMRIHIGQAIFVVVRSMNGASDDEITRLLERTRKQESE